MCIPPEKAGLVLLCLFKASLLRVRGHGPRGGVLEPLHDVRLGERARTHDQREALHGRRRQQPRYHGLRGQGRSLLGQQYFSVHPGEAGVRALGDRGQYHSLPSVHKLTLGLTLRCTCSKHAPGKPISGRSRFPVSSSVTLGRCILTHLHVFLLRLL